MSTIRRTATLVRAVLAAAIMGALMVGVPVLLLTLIGSPVPQQIDWSFPVTDEALLGVVACIAWVFWLQMAVCLIVEIAAEVRLTSGRSADWLSRVPGTFGGQQALARALVQTVIAVGLSSAVGSSLSAYAASAQPPGVTSAVGVSAPAQLQLTLDQTGEALTPTHTHVSDSATVITVEKGDSLWAIAEDHLGGGLRWREIAELNEGRLMSDGHRFANADSILPGWTLVLPQTPQPSTHSVTVHAGNTLSGIAEQTYGDGTRWPRIFQANRDRIDDPDVLTIGQRLRLPTQQPQSQTRQSPTREPRPAPSRHHSVTRSTGTAPDHHDMPPSETTTPTHGEPPSPPAPQPTPGLQPSTTGTAHQEASSPTDTRPWAVTIAVLGTGALLAAGLLTGLAARRRSQFRVRRSGRTIPQTPPHLLATEREVRTNGSAASESARFLDAALRNLAAEQAATAPLPDVRAVRITETALELILAEPRTTLPSPWVSGEDRTRWRLDREGEMSPVAGAAPYPTLVSIGTDSAGGCWLVDLEAAGITDISGDQDAAGDLCRFVTAELAVNAWASTVDIDVVGADMLVALNPARVNAIGVLDIGRLTNAARRAREASQTTGMDTLRGRQDQDAADSWMPSISIHVTPGLPVDGIEELRDELAQVPGRSPVALLRTCGDTTATAGLKLRLTSQGLETPWGTLTPFGMTEGEATALAELFEKSDDAEDEPMPVLLDPDGTVSDTDVAGAIRNDLVRPRHRAGDESSLLPRPDEVYMTAAATTPDDLTTLAPRVPPETASRIAEADPTLDDDLHSWYDPDSRRPRIRLLGPVEVRVTGPRPNDVGRRTAYYAELVAYLVNRPGGSTPAQMADAFGIQNNTLHSRIGTLRKWLGTDPKTDSLYLPESTLSTAGRTRGVPVYQLSGLLSDADLFRRLRARGQARGGPDGIADLVEALTLVDGPPFDQPRRLGYGWLADNPLDHFLTAAIVDVAHVVATHALAQGDPDRAVWAAERAIMVAPSEEKPHLDLMKARQDVMPEAAALREFEKARCKHTQGDAAPPEPTQRTLDMLTTDDVRKTW